MSWNRKEVGNLLLAGAGTITALEAVIFSKWVDAALGEKKELANLVGEIGLCSTLILTIGWVVCRIIMNQKLPAKEKLSWAVSSVIIGGLVLMAIGWFLSIK